MASTSVHLPEDLVARLDQIARESGRSRNRVILEALEAYVSKGRKKWPEDFLPADRLDDRDTRELRESLREWISTLRSSRRNRGTGPF
ncbi:MAG: CopG family ribbon-helix-helix protein [Vicinamibacteria bacterium]